MGLQSELDLSPVSANAAQRGLQRIGATRVGTALFSLLLAPIDRGIYRVSQGRFTAGRSLGALPVIMLTTIGARSGRQRTTPLNAIPFGEDLALVGTNYGKGRTPSWAHNLRANPKGVVAFEGRQHPVIAVEAAGAQYEAGFAAAIRVYPGYARYRNTATNEIPIFILSSEGED
jgi:deazaflavin-dependent oxidoreductase (nitroreductase family)